MALVHMRHKDSKDGSLPAVTTEEAFHDVWQAKGWQLTDDQGVFLPAGKTAPASAPAATSGPGAPPIAPTGSGS